MRLNSGGGDGRDGQFLERLAQAWHIQSAAAGEGGGGGGGGGGRRRSERVGALHTCRRRRRRKQEEEEEEEEEHLLHATHPTRLDSTRGADGCDSFAQGLRQRVPLCSVCCEAM
jgi:hypothetical protein